MAWDSIQTSSDCIDLEEWNTMVTYIKAIDSLSETNYITSSNSILRFYPSSVGHGTSGSVSKLWLWSANKSLYANSANIRFRFKPSSGIWVFASSQKLSGQLMAIHSARDINNWNPSSWHNSGLMWNNTISKWVPHKSGASTGGGISDLSDLTIDVDKDWNTKSIYNLTSISAQRISGGVIRFNRFSGATSATALELEQLTNGSTTTLHQHAGIGVDEFTDLTDVPNSYTGKTGKIPIVNSTEDGLIFVDIVCANIGTKTIYESTVTEDPQIVFTSDGVVFA